MKISFNNPSLVKRYVFCKQDVRQKKVVLKVRHGQLLNPTASLKFKLSMIRPAKATEATQASHCISQLTTLISTVLYKAIRKNNIEDNHCG